MSPTGITCKFTCCPVCSQPCKTHPIKTTHPIILQHCSGRVCLTPLQPRLLPQYCPIHPRPSHTSAPWCAQQECRNPGFLSLAVQAGQPSPCVHPARPEHTPNPQPRQQVYKLDPLSPARGQSAPGMPVNKHGTIPSRVTIRRAEYAAQSPSSKSLEPRSGRK